MKHGKGTDLPGMPRSQGERIGVIYVAPDDDLKTILTMILAEDRHKREKVVLVLPQTNHTFQRLEHFDALTMLRSSSKLRGELIFIIPAGPGPAEFARQRHFTVFPTIENFVRSLPGATPPLPTGTDKTTKVLPPPETAGTANPPSTPTTPPSTNPNRNTGKVAAAGVLGAGAGGALTGNATGKTPAAPSRPPTNTGKRPATPARNAGAGNALTPAGNINAISAGWPPPSPNRPRSPRGARPTNRSRRAILLVALLIILTLLVIGGLTVSANPSVAANLRDMFNGNAPPPTTITITPFSKTVQDTYILQSVNGDSNIANRLVGTRQLTSTKTVTKQVTLTHVHQDPTPATGSITFFNGSAASRLVTKALTPFPVGNVEISLDADVTVPGNNLPQEGQITVTAHAVQLGTIGNIPARAINMNPCCGNSSLSAVNQNAFAGGTDAVDYNILKQSDVNAVTSANQGTLKTSAQNDITGQKKTNEQFLGNINCDDPNVTSDVVPGAHAQITTTNVTVSITCNAQVYDINAIQTIVQNTLPQKANTDSQLGPAPVLAGAITSQIQPQTQSDGTITSFSVTASGLWYYNWTDTKNHQILLNRQNLFNKIKGISETQALSILKNNYTGISDATISINNGGTSLPSDVSQITLKINVPTGPSSGSNQTATPVGSTPTPTH